MGRAATETGTGNAHFDVADGVPICPRSRPWYDVGMAESRKRSLSRRRVVAALLLLFAVLGGYFWWTFFHSSDPRVVGRWTGVYADGRRSPVHMQYNADGTGACYDYSQPETMPLFAFNWRVDGAYIVTSKRPKERGFTRVRLAEFWKQLTEDEPEYRFEIVEITPHEMRINTQPPDPPQSLMYERLSQSEIDSFVPPAGF
jgi:hypothetical protein